MGGQRLGNRKGRKASKRGCTEGRGHKHGAADASGDTNAFQRGPHLPGRKNEHVVQPCGRGRRRFPDSVGSGRPGESERDRPVLTEQKAWPGSWPLLWLL